VIRFDIIGIPSPQAGMRAVNTARGARMITTGGVGLKSWRTAVADTAREQAAIHGCLDVPLALTVTFRFPMPKGAPKFDRDAGIRYRARTPDLDKVLRSLFDGFTAGGLITDDAILVKVEASKVEVWQAWTGAAIELDEAIPL
jgi:Holliday junction resolvase RusA-like endonuclease